MVLFTSLEIILKSDHIFWFFKFSWFSSGWKMCTFLFNASFNPYHSIPFRPLAAKKKINPSAAMRHWVILICRSFSPMCYWMQSRYCLSNGEENEWINVVNATQIYCWSIVIYYLFIENSNFPPFVSDAGYTYNTDSQHQQLSEDPHETIWRGCWSRNIWFSRMSLSLLENFSPTQCMLPSAYDSIFRLKFTPIDLISNSNDQPTGWTSAQQTDKRTIYNNGQMEPRKKGIKNKTLHSRRQRENIELDWYKYCVNVDHKMKMTNNTKLKQFNNLVTSAF